MEMSGIYQQRADQFAADRVKANSKIKQLAWTRVVIMLGIGFVVYVGLTNSLYFWILLPLVLIFILLVRKQVAWRRKSELAENLKLLNEQELKAIRNETTSFANGISYSEEQHPYSHDLDLFGKGSIFQHINRSGTQLGESRLARDLKNPTYTKEKLKERQESIRELAQWIDFRQQVWAHAKLQAGNTLKLQLLMDWLKVENFIINKPILTVAKWVLPVITISLGVYASFVNLSFFSFFFAMMIVQAGIAGFFNAKISAMQTLLSHGKDALASYGQLFKLMANQNATTSLLKKHHAYAKAAHEQVSVLANLVNALESRMNPIAMQFGNGIFSYDFHTVTKLEVWRSKHRDELPVWLESLTEWDALLSPATLHFNFPQYAFAETELGNQLAGKEIGHLLLPVNKRVSNDFEMGNPKTIWLITGANMAGKSTFLRALGVNFVLGNIGSPVCAKTWRAPLVTLRTGMRTTDSLQEHHSYFYAELYRLQSIMEELKKGVPLFILLDEILKGTNSTDKQSGSRELLKQFKDKHALVVLATHDIALGDLEEQYPDKIGNASFEGKIEADELTFDYTLNRGVAEKANATFLMKKMGIIP